MKNITLIGCISLILISACKKKEFEPGSNNSINLSTGLISSYEFNGNAVDGFGGNNGSINGATLTEGHNGTSNSAYSFNGIDNSIAIPGSSFYFANFSYNLWYKPSQLPANGSAYYLLAVGSSGADHNLLLSNNYGVSNGLCGGSSNDPNVPYNNTLAIPGYIPSLNSWYMITLCRDDNNLKIYINSELKSTSSVNSTKPKYNKSNDYLTIGSRQSSFFTKGVIDDVRIYNRVLTIDEIIALYKL